MADDHHHHEHEHEHDHHHHNDEHHHKHDHHHSHEHGEDCDHCGDGNVKTMVRPEDVDDEPVPEWKKRALEQTMDPSVAPFGGSWNVESVTAAKKDPDRNHHHAHTHEHMDHPGIFEERSRAGKRDYKERAFTVGLGGPVGSGKTALMLCLCQKLRHRLSLGAVTNDIFTREDGEFLTRKEALPKERILAVETGGCPHAAIREDISANLHACEVLTARFDPLHLLLVESGGDNLAANFSPELADFTLYVIDVAGGDKVPRKGGPGVTQSDVLVVNKTDLADAVGSSLEVMRRDAQRMRGSHGPTVFAQCKQGLGAGVDEIVDHVLRAWSAATGGVIPPK